MAKHDKVPPGGTEDVTGLAVEKAMAAKEIITADWLVEQNRYARSLFTNTITRADMVDDMLQDKLEIEQDAGDVRGAQVTQTVRAGAILDRVRQMMQVDSAVFRVVPLKAGDAELKACTKIERWLRGFDERYYHETSRNPDRDAAFWYLVRGVCRTEVRLRPELKGKDKLPIEILNDDPRYIYPVWGRRDLLWYTKESQVYVRELRREIEGRGEDASWLPEDQNSQLEVIEYNDANWYAAAVSTGEEDKRESHLLLRKNHRLGFVPMAEGRCMDAPYAAAEFAYQSVIGPVLDHLKQYYILLSKLATGVNLFYYPQVFYVDINGQPSTYDLGNPPLDVKPMPPGAKYEVVHPQPNSQLLQQLMGAFLSDINLRTIPETAFGQEPKTLESGFAISQVLSAVQAAIQDKLPNLERAMGYWRGMVLRMVSDVGEAEGMDFGVPGDNED